MNSNQKSPHTNNSVTMHNYKSEIKRHQQRQDHKREKGHIRVNNKRYRRANIQLSLPQHRIHQLVYTRKVEIERKQKYRCKQDNEPIRT